MSSFSLSLKLQGGLGNQMYQVASAYSLSKIYNRKLHIYTNDFVYRYKLHPLLITKVFRGALYIPSVNRFILPKASEKHPGFDITLFNKVNFYNRLSLPNIFIQGYLQSLSYFYHDLGHFKAHILGNLHESYSSKFDGFLKELLPNSLSVHLRGGDKLSASNRSIYYTPSSVDQIAYITQASEATGISDILLFGDDIQYLQYFKSTLDELFNIYIFKELYDESSPLADFYALTRSKALLLSNSTFSLWAAYLSDSDDIYCLPHIYNTPYHPSVQYHTLEDLYLPNWKSLTRI